MLLRILKWVGVLTGLLAVGAGIVLYIVLYAGNSFSGVAKREFYVNKGMTWNDVVDSLDASGIIRSRQLFEWAVLISRKGTGTHVGKYVFKSGISNSELYNDLRRGTGIVPISVTLKEGRRMATFARAFARTIDIDTSRFLALVEDPEFCASLGVSARNLEGYLSPNTYQFNWQSDEEEIIKRLVKQTDKIFTDELLARARKLRLTKHQVLTLASIIEGEAYLDEERARISGVYHNRLRKGMKLEADPTIQFLLPDGPRRVLLRDLQIKSPYNTYMYYGLPPGPISNPREASIIAALYPEQHPFLFFVADGKGGHWFSKDYNGHLNNVKRFRRERAERIREDERERGGS